MQWSVATEEERMHEGANFISLLWSEISKKVIEKSVQVYELTSEQAEALRKAFRRYEIRPT
jgi:hypothetical protein